MKTREVELPPPPSSPGLAEWARECVRILDHQIDLLTAERNIYLQLLDSFQQGAAPGATESPPATSPASVEAIGAAAHGEAQGAVSPDIDLTELDVDLDGAQNTVERIVWIATAAPDKLLNVTQLARLLIRTGSTTAKINNMRVMVQRTLDGRPDLFERVRRATYRYTAGGNEDHDLDSPGDNSNQAS